MRSTATAFRLTLLAVLLLAPSALAAESEGRIYGRVTTDDGEVYEGLIRWDKNEVSWLDVLNGSKSVVRSNSGKRRRGEVSLLGFRFRYDDDRAVRESGIRFGHLRSLENTGRDRALLTLRNGDEVELQGGSTDIGTDSRGIVVEDARRGVVELEWTDVARVDFAPAPAGLTSRFGERLSGTLTTRRGNTFTGLVCWDVDEVTAEDVLDGEDEGGRDYDVRFGNIAVIERHSSSRALVTLRNGEEVLLHGTNDVNDDNRGILVLDPALGQVRVGWDDFDHLVFDERTRPYRYNEFPGQGALRGTVETRDGDKFSGAIRWDDDEAFAWEFLDGEQDGVSFDIEFGFVHAVERLSANAARVTLRDGRAFDLRDSNDVNDDNDGIFVQTSGGDEVLIEWDDFERAVFDKP